MLAVEVGFDLTVAKYKRSAKNKQINRFKAGVFYTKTLLAPESKYKSLSYGSGAAANGCGSRQWVCDR